MITREMIEAAIAAFKDIEETSAELTKVAHHINVTPSFMIENAKRAYAWRLKFEAELDDAPTLVFPRLE